MRLLVIEDSPLDYEMLVVTLAVQGVRAQATRVEDAVGLREALSRTSWDLVISDHHLPGFSSGQALEIVRAQKTLIPFIIVSGVIGEEAAVEAMRRGADDYLIKGRLARLGMAVRNAVDAAQVRKDKAAAEARLQQSQEQLRNLSNRLQARIDEERAAIAREIHDEVGGTLTAVRFDLNSLEQRLTAEPLERLRRAQAALAQATQATQRIMQDLRPPILDAGLVAALEWQVQQFRQRVGIDVRFHSYSPRVKVDTPLAMVVYRTCQEALTNITKHAGASKVSVDLHYGKGVLSMEVSDDGRGLTADALRKPGCLGLRGLAERARAVGGSLDISSAGGRTALMLWLPVPAAQTPLLTMSAIS